MDMDIECLCSVFSRCSTGISNGVQTTEAVEQ